MTLFAEQSHSYLLDVFAKIVFSGDFSACPKCPVVETYVLCVGWTLTVGA